MALPSAPPTAGPAAGPSLLASRPAAWTLASNAGGRPTHSPDQPATSPGAADTAGEGMPADTSTGGLPPGGRPPRALVVGPTPDGEDPVQRLTPYQTRLMGLRAEGMSQAETAKELGVSLATLKNDQHATLALLGAGSLPEGIALLRARGVLLPGQPYGLTKRELDVMTLRGAGLTAKEVAARLFFSEKTVRDTQAGVLARIGATSLPDGVEFLRSKGLIPPALFKGLWPWELDTLKMRLGGKTGQEVGEELGVKRQWAAEYQRAALDKLGVAKLEDARPPLEAAGLLDPALPHKLKQRELDVMRLLGAGKTQDQVAEFGVSRATIANVRASALAKLGVETLPQALECLHSKGLLTRE